MSRSPFFVKRLLPYVFQALVVAAIAFYAFKLGSYDLRVPFSYTGDSVVILMFIKGMILNGWTFSIPQLSAPFGMSAAAFPIMSNFDWLIMKVISLFTSEVGLVLNVFWLGTLVLSSATSSIAMRLLGIGRVYAFGAGVLYAFLPYALLRNVAHMNLVYYLVPLLGLLAIHIASGLHIASDRLTRYIAYAACLAQGFDYVYYSFFSVLLFAFAAIVGYASTRSRRVLEVAATAIGLVVLSSALNLSPSIYSWFSIGKPPEMNYKYPAEAEIYGAKIRKLIAPHQNNRVPGLREWGKRDVDNAYPNENENITSRLGPAASVGFVILLLISVRILRPPRGRHGDILSTLAPLSLFTLLFITVGGLGAIFNVFFFSDIRAYNRFSVFLAFFALSGLGGALHAWTPHRQIAKWLIYLCLAFLLLLSLYDQLLDRAGLVSNQHADAERYRIERTVASNLHALYPAGASILQLPLTGFPPLSIHERMQSYDHLRPFLWSGKNLKWSWPSFSQRHRAWQERLAGEPPEAIVEAALYSGFNAIWIDRDGYKDAAGQLIFTLEANGASRNLDHPRYAVFDLSEAKRQLLKKLGEAEFSRRREDWLESIEISWGQGFYGPEVNSEGEAFRWSSNKSTIDLFNDSRLHRKIKMNFDMGAQGAGTVFMKGGIVERKVELNGRQHISLDFDLAPAAKLKLVFDATGARVNAPGDTRNLYFYIANFAIDEKFASTGGKSE